MTDTDAITDAEWERAMQQREMETHATVTPIHEPTDQQLEDAIQESIPTIDYGAQKDWGEGNALNRAQFSDLMRDAEEQQAKAIERKAEKIRKYKKGVETRIREMENDLLDSQVILASVQSAREKLLNGDIIERQDAQAIYTDGGVSGEGEV